jgi:hypothetical protein
MRIMIANKGDGNIVTISELQNPESTGEVAHFIAELELVKLDLLELWDGMKHV